MSSYWLLPKCTDLSLFQLFVIVSAFKIFWFTSHFSPALALKTVFAEVYKASTSVHVGNPVWSQKSDKLHCIITGTLREVTVLANGKDIGNHEIINKVPSEIITLSLWWFGKLIAESFVSLFSIVPWRGLIWLKQQEVYYFSCFFWLSKHGICVHLFFVCSLFYLTRADIYERMTSVSSSIIMQLFFWFPFILK